MFPLFDQKNQNKIDFFQIWINLPSYNKRSQPNFEIFWNDDIPKISVMDDKGIETVVELICGKYNDNIAPQPPQILGLKMKKPNGCLDYSIKRIRGI